MGLDLNLAGINTAMRGLYASQQALATAGNDITNANTEGFSREGVDLVSLAPMSQPGFSSAAGAVNQSLGSGVDVAKVSRFRDRFLDEQYRSANLYYGEQDTLATTTKQVEDLFNEPSDNGLNALMGKFFDAWNSVAANPTEAASRGALREAATALANGLNETSAGLTNLRGDLDMQIRSTVQDINSISKQLADLNGQIATASQSGAAPNELLDRRDLLLDKLSKMADVQASERSDGTTWVYLFGKAVVTGQDFQPLGLQPNGDMNLSNVSFNGEPIAAKDIGGTLKGLISARDEVIGRPKVPATGSLLQDTPNGLLYQLDVVANKLAGAVNLLHYNGTDLAGASPSKTNFFTIGTATSTAAQFNTGIINAANISVNPVFSAAGGLDKIVAGGPISNGVVPSPGDNTTAVAIAGLRNATLTDGTMNTPQISTSAVNPDGTTSITVSGGQFSLLDFYRNVLSSVGQQSQAAQALSKNQQTLMDHVDQQRQSVSGVNLDEEMSNMVKFQHTYQASARVLNTFDQMLDTIINSMGK